MADEFPHKLKGQSKRPAQTVASASRTATTGRSGKKVRLTPSQVAIAKKLGVPLEEYAKYVKE
jgi:phage I-like protein